MLGANGVPVHGDTCTKGNADDAFNVTYCNPPTTTPTWDKTVDYYSAWYTDTAYSKTIVQTLTLGGAPVKVKCLEIREDSVVVSINGGEQKEVRLKGQ